MDLDILIGGIIIGLLSAPVAAIKKPRFFWGSAAFDPISFFWMVSFFLYGPLGALISTAIGAAAICRFSREATPVLGGILKSTGTTTVWLTLLGAAVLSGDHTAAGASFADPGLYIPAVLAAGAVRSLIEIPLCYRAIPFFLTRNTGKTVTGKNMLEQFGGMRKYILIMVFLNFYLTVLDAVFSWIIAFQYPVVQKEYNGIVRQFRQKSNPDVSVQPGIFFPSTALFLRKTKLSH
jgi:hypothetical protein